MDLEPLQEKESFYHSHSRTSKMKNIKVNYKMFVTEKSSK